MEKLREACHRHHMDYLPAEFYYFKLGYLLTRHDLRHGRGRRSGIELGPAWLLCFWGARVARGCPVSTWGAPLSRPAAAAATRLTSATIIKLYVRVSVPLIVKVFTAVFGCRERVADFKLS